MPLHFYFWVIRSATRVILVDTGCREETAVARGRTYISKPVELLAEIGISARAIADVVITHMHYDHCGNMHDFPNARFHIQEAEMDYCGGRDMRHEMLRRPFERYDVTHAAELVRSGRMKCYNGETEIAPGIRLHLVGGHTKGLQVVSVPTKRGTVVLASDAAHYWDNIRLQSPFPIVVRLDDMLDAFEKIEALADGPWHVIPGHDPEVAEMFPMAGTNRNIVLLHEPPSQSAPSRRDVVSSATSSRSSPPPASR